MTPPEVGDVIAYSYLWRREHRIGEQSGRKVRPCVVVVAVRRSGSGAVLVVVAPITSQQPQEHDVAVALPRALKAALKLNAEHSWVICSEVNQFTWPGFDLGFTPQGSRTYGRIPKSLLQRIREEIISSRARSTNRDE